MGMDLIVGGGMYGLRAARCCLENGHSVCVFDPDPSCRVARFLALEEPGTAGIAFIPGGVRQAYRFFVAHQPEWIFPTAPVHVVARLLAEACGLHEYARGIDPFIAHVPEGVRAGRSGADVFLSFNVSRTCIPECPSRCPVTGKDRPVLLYAQLREWCPEAVILESVQQAPGLGAIRGTDLSAAISRVQEIPVRLCRDRMPMPWDPDRTCRTGNSGPVNFFYSGQQFFTKNVYSLVQPKHLLPGKNWFCQLLCAYFRFTTAMAITAAQAPRVVTIPKPGDAGVGVVAAPASVPSASRMSDATISRASTIRGPPRSTMSESIT